MDPYIGTGGHGHTFLGVAAPFGAVQIGPNNINKGWDWCSGYHYSDSIVIGFSHLHLNGTGCSDTGDLLFMPYTGKMRTQPGTQDNPLSGYASYYSKSDETALPGYYGVVLKTHRTKVELTASDRVAFHRYTFPKNVEKYVMINLKDANGDDRPTDTYLEQVNDTTVSGYRCSSGWSKQQQIYFTAVFSEPIRLALFHDSIPVQGNVLQGIDVKGNVIVSSDVERLDVKVGISPVSMENAAANIRQEIADWNFERVVDETTAKWNAELSKLQVSTTDTVAKRIFFFIQLYIMRLYNRLCSMIVTRNIEVPTKMCMEIRVSPIIPYSHCGIRIVRLTHYIRWCSRSVFPILLIRCWLFMSNKDVCRFGICMARTRMK